MPDLSQRQSAINQFNYVNVSVAQTRTIKQLYKYLISYVNYCHLKLSKNLKHHM